MSSVRDLLARCLVAAGARRTFGAGAGALDGVPHHEVDDPALAARFADAAGRVGRGPGVAIVGEDRYRLSATPGAEADPVLVTSAEEIPEAVAGWGLVGGVGAPGAVELVFDLDLWAPAPDDLVPLTMTAAAPVAPTLGADLRGLRIMVIAGPGVLRAGCVDDLRSMAAATGIGVLNTWGAKGVFRWDSPFHLGTAGLQADDFELGGATDADILILCGVDPAECPPSLWRDRPALEVAPQHLGALGLRWGDPLPDPERPRLYTELASALAPLYATEGAPLTPAKAAADLADVLPAGGMVVADPGPAGLWVARTLPTVEPGSVVVPATNVRGFAAAAAFVRGLDGLPTIAVTHDPIDPSTAEVLDHAVGAKADVVVEVWGADADEMASAADHRSRLLGALGEGGVLVLPTPVDFSWTRTLVEVAGPVTAWV